MLFLPLLLFFSAAPVTSARIWDCRWVVVPEVNRRVIGDSTELVRSQGDTVVMVMFCGPHPGRVQ